MLVRSCGVCGEIGHNRASCGGSGQASRESEKRFRRRIRLEDSYPGLYEKLGKFQDSQLAEEFGLSRERIRQIREEFDVPKFKLQIPKEAESLLGQVSDRELARTFEVPSSRIAKARKVQKVEPHKNQKSYDELLKDPSSKVGVISDRKVARKLGIAICHVRDFRIKQGIPPAVLSPRCKDFVPLSRPLIAKMFAEGRSEEEIAETLGTTKHYIRVILSRDLRILLRPTPRKST